MLYMQHGSSGLPSQCDKGEDRGDTGRDLQQLTGYGERWRWGQVAGD